MASTVLTSRKTPHMAAAVTTTGAQKRMPPRVMFSVSSRTEKSRRNHTMIPT